MNEGFRHKIARLAANSRIRGGYARFHRRYDTALSITERLLGGAVYVASLAVVVCMLLYSGFDSGAVDKKLLMRILYSAQAVFLVTIVFNLIFRFRATMRESLFIKRFADLAMLLTLVPVIWPHTSGPVDSVLHFLHSRYYLFAGLGIYSLAEICYGTMQLLGRRTNPSLILSASFLFFILLGSFVLMLPRCTTTPLRYIDALFMASSAVSMTGLCTVDVPTVFTPMGWLVIAVLMQIGALGVLTFTSFFALFFSGKASIYNQLLMRDFVYSKSIGALMPVILYILAFTLCVESIGAVAIYFTLPDGFLPTVKDKVIFSAFHSLSAFCNGGFTTVKDGMANPALMQSNQSIYVVMSILILAGGIGFPNLVNFKDAAVEQFRRLRGWITGRGVERRVHIYDVNTKIVLAATAILFVFGTVAFYILEYNHSFHGLPTGKRIIQSIFCSATVRTAGFATYGPEDWLGVTFLIAMFLMWVGCASQSMGGGIKVNAFAAVMLNLRSIVHGQKGVTVFNRTIAPSSIRRANAVVCFSIFAILLYSCLIMLLQPELPMKAVMFESFSAITTIGMSLGITPELSDLSKVAIATAMFLGRVGIISVLCGLIGNRPDHSPYLPTDDIIIN